MTGELFGLFLTSQLVLSAAIGAVLLLRRLPIGFDPDTRLWLWMIPVAAAFVSMIPRDDGDAPAARPWAGTMESRMLWLTGVWLFGVVAAVLRVTALHLAFLREVKRGRAGPAVMGVGVPRIVMPHDLAVDPGERALIRAHEWEHIRRNDVGVRHLLALAQCLFWFNPLIHLAAAEIRFDQELACDDAVVRRLGRRRQYAETLLRRHSAAASPLGCHWRRLGAHPLEIRLTALARRPVSEPRRVLMCALLLAAGLIAVSVGYAAAPAHRPPPMRADALSGHLPEVNLPRISSRD